MVVYIFLKQESEEAMPTGEYSIVEHRQPVKEIYLSTESIKEGKIELSQHKHNILVEVVAYHAWNPHITIAALEYKESEQKLELTYTKICGTHSLSTLLTLDANSDVGFHNHTHIICTISNCKC